jgi:cyanophycinase
MPQNRRFLLMGSGEFEAWSEGVERAAVDGADPSVVILPTASAHEGDAVFDRWAAMGLEHYRSMGWPAAVLPVKSRADAEREDHARALDDAGLVFFSGGNPRRLAEAIHGTPLWEALTAAMDRGAVYAGCSAGAMIASQTPDQARARGAKASWVFGLGLVPNVSFGVHWDKVRRIPGAGWFVTRKVPDRSWFVGIDERTAILGDGREWTVFGLGGAHVAFDGGRRTYRAGERFTTDGA